MIRLYIDNKEVALEEGTSFEIVRENPLITKSGDYSLDVDVNITYKSNYSIFKGIDRIHTLTNFSDKRFELRNNMKVLMAGVVRLLSYADEVVSVQLLSNNSSVSSIFDPETEIRKMDLGTCFSCNDMQTARGFNLYCYGDKDGDMNVTEAYPVLFENGFVDYGDNILLYNTYDRIERLYPQPYLLFIIDSFFKAIGVKVVRNDIDFEQFRHLVIVHGYDSKDYAKMLPAWTVSQFIEEIEKFFNVVISFDTYRREVSICNVKSYYDATDNIVSISDNKIIDRFEVSQEDLSSIQTVYKNFGYRLGGDEYWRFANIDSNLLKDSNIIEREFWQEWNKEYDSTELNIYHDEEKDLYFMHYENDTGENRYFRMVQHFSDVSIDESVGKTELLIRPALVLTSYRVDDDGSYMFAAPVPHFFQNEDIPFSNLIREGIQDNADEVMDVAYYVGYVKTRDIGGGPNAFRYMPQAISTFWQQQYNIVWSYNNDDSLFDGWGEKYTLSLNSRNGRFMREFQNDLYVDTSKLFKIKFISDEFLDPKSVFVIRNKKFVCKTLKYDITDGKLERVVEGEFFPVK